VNTSASYEIHKAIFKFEPFQRLVIAHYSQEAPTHLKEQTVPVVNSLEQLIATANQSKLCRIWKICRSFYGQANLGEVPIRCAVLEPAAPKVGYGRMADR
jgi:hypothetical protein